MRINLQSPVKTIKIEVKDKKFEPLSDELIKDRIGLYSIAIDALNSGDIDSLSLLKNMYYDLKSRCNIVDIELEYFLEIESHHGQPRTSENLDNRIHEHCLKQLKVFRKIK